eukprot:gb/GECG01002480.1/.p1 GENE.gb/GECG01002480.1/~~gb/GECG01002480.1/.p1  ORF type:complete len:384 (+),score=27.82 gb/GECG01002480.1/:1-1152(+)
MDAFEIHENNDFTTSEDFYTEYNDSVNLQRPIKRPSGRNWRFSRACIRADGSCLVIYRLNWERHTAYSNDRVSGLLISEDGSTMLLQSGIHSSQCFLREGVPRHWKTRLEIADVAHEFLDETLRSRQLRQTADHRYRLETFGRKHVPHEAPEILKEFCRAEHLCQTPDYTNVIGILLPEAVILATTPIVRQGTVLYNWLGTALGQKAALGELGDIIGAISTVKNWWLHLSDFLSFERVDVLKKYHIRSFALQEPYLYTETLLQQCERDPPDSFCSFYLPSLDLWKMNRYLANAVLLGHLLNKHISKVHETTYMSAPPTQPPENSYAEGRRVAISSRDPAWHPHVIKERLEEEGRQLHRRRQLLNRANAQISSSKCFLLTLSRS